MSTTSQNPQDDLIGTSNGGQADEDRKRRWYQAAAQPAARGGPGRLRLVVFAVDRLSGVRLSASVVRQADRSEDPQCFAN